MPNLHNHFHFHRNKLEDTLSPTFSIYPLFMRVLSFEDQSIELTGVITLGTMRTNSLENNQIVFSLDVSDDLLFKRLQEGHVFHY